MDTYCWIHSTFTLPKFVDSQVAPGVGPIPVADEDEIVEHKYYQWVCFTLFLQVQIWGNSLVYIQKSYGIT